MSDHLSTKYQIKKGLIVQKIDKETVMYDVDGAKIHILNEAASFIFQKLKSKYNITQIINSLMQRYVVTKEMAEKDINDFIKSLINKNLLRYNN